MYLNTNLLFERILTFLKPDVILDVGSRDGREALRFKSMCPASTVIAYEANPYQFSKMASDSSLAGFVTLRNAAVTSAKGKANFFIANADYDREENLDNNLGQSSLLGDAMNAKKMVSVETTSVDDELDSLPKANTATCALWIDVEGAEADVIGGCLKHRRKIQLIHVECATRPKRSGQKSMHDLERLLRETHVNLGHTSTLWRGWGDAVFVSRHIISLHSVKIKKMRDEARSAWLRYIASRLLTRLSGKC